MKITSELLTKETGVPTWLIDRTGFAGEEKFKEDLFPSFTKDEFESREKAFREHRFLLSLLRLWKPKARNLRGYS
jgi:hypothetical protein